MRLSIMRSLLWLMLALCSIAGFAQAKRTISGIVKDDEGNGISGISYTVKGTTTSGITDAQGNFTVSVSGNNPVIIFTSIGYLKNEVTVGESNSLSVTMADDVKSLNEVVVTGFGIRKQTRKLSYSVSEVKGSDLTRANNANLVNSLQGKVAGVMINQGASGPQSSSRIRIRGNASISNSNTQPLVVLDGVLIEPGTTGNDSWGENPDFGNIMKNLNPDDYESVTVLKGAAASALYGSKAQNGVLLITTKKGRQRKGLGVSFSHSESFDNAYKLYDLQNQFGGGLNPTFEKDANGVEIVDPIAAYWNGGYSYGPAFDGRTVKEIDGRMIKWEANKPLDFFETGKYINSNVAVEGGSDVTTFRFSYSNLMNSSVLPDNSLNRNSFALRATQKLGKILNLDASVNYSNLRSTNPGRNGSNENPLFAFTYYRPRHVDIPYYMSDYIDPAGGYRGRSDPPNLDPYALSRTAFRLFEDRRKQKENNLIANIDLTANVTPWLNFLVRANANVYNDKFERKQLGEGANFSGGVYQISQTSYTTYRVQALANISRQFGDDYDLNFSLGGETYRHTGNNFNSSQTDGGLKVPRLYTIANSVNAAIARGESGAGRRTDALYAYGDLTWKDMLTLNVSGRNDWSSTLTYRDGHGDHSYFYPSVGLAWIFTELPSFKQSSSSILSFGKLRASFSYTGLDAAAQLTNSAGYYGLTGQFNSVGNTNRPIYTFNSGTIGNPNLKNELSRELEIGLDLRFFNNRLGFDVAYYKKNTKNQIIELPVPTETGASTRLLQAGNVQNQGIEILMTANPVKGKYFNWNSTINFTRNRNKIIELYPGVASKELELAFGADVVAKAIEGQEYGVIETGHGYAIYQAKDADGKPIDHPSNGKRVIGSAPNGSTNGAYTFMRSQDYDGTKKILGTIMEKFLLSTTQEFTYKNFNLNIQVDSKIGGLMASATHQYGSANGSMKNSLFGRNAELGGIQYDDNGVTKNDGIIPDGVLNDGITVTAGGQTVDLGG
ncbi:MAG TPA: SusC/RagA family TonB-linked outer membrane protein, partial [Chitinophagaceae bacterium]|nr:SusC/RagA family TonB-linked outer membrane protein [Chitinophagaceae bacterium]